MKTLTERWDALSRDFHAVAQDRAAGEIEYDWFVSRMQDLHEEFKSISDDMGKRVMSQDEFEFATLAMEDCVIAKEEAWDAHAYRLNLEDRASDEQDYKWARTH